MTDQPSILRRVSTPRNVLSFLFGGALLVLTARSLTNVDWNSAVAYLRNTDPLLFLAALGVFHGLSIIRSLRWRILLQNVGYQLDAHGSLGSLVELTRVIYLGWFANCVTVARLGDVYRCSLLQRSTGIGLSVTAGTLLTERIIDLGVLVVALSASITIAFWGNFPSFVIQATLAGALLVGIGLIGILLLRHGNESIEQLVPGRFQRPYERIRHSTLDSLNRVPTLVGYTGIGWVIEGVTMYLVGASLGIHLTVASAFIAAFVAVLLSTIPITPGGLGITEAGIALVLGWIGLDPTAVAAVTILNRLISYWSVVFVGLALFVIGVRFPIALSATTTTNRVRTFDGES